MRTYLIISIFFASLTSLTSQNYVDILKLTGGTTAQNKFDSSATTSTINDFAADLTYPIKLNDSNSIITGVIYEHIESKLFEDGPVKEFSSITVKIGLNKRFTDTWSGTFVMLPKISSDLKKIGEQDFQGGAIALMKYKKNENLTYKVGLYYNSELFGPFFVPMLGLYYMSPNKKFESNITLPLQVDFNYKVIKLINVGINYNGQMRTYHLNDATPNLKSAYLAKAANELFGYIKFNVGKSICVLSKVGYSLGRSYRVYDESALVNFGMPLLFVGNKRKQQNTDFADGMLIQFGLLYRFSLEK